MTPIAYCATKYYFLGTVARSFEVLIRQTVNIFEVMEYVTYQVVSDKRSSLFVTDVSRELHKIVRVHVSS